MSAVGAQQGDGGAGDAVGHLLVLGEGGVARRSANSTGGSNRPRRTLAVRTWRTASSSRSRGSSPLRAALSRDWYASVFFSARHGTSTMSAPALTAITAARPTP